MSSFVFGIVAAPEETKDTAAADQPRDEVGLLPSTKESETAVEPPATSASAGSVTKHGDVTQSATAIDEPTETEGGKADAESEQQQQAVEQEESTVPVDSLINCLLLRHTVNFTVLGKSLNVI